MIPVTFARDAVAITTSGLHWGRSLVDQPRTLRNPGVKALWLAMVPVGVAFYLVERGLARWTDCLHVVSQDEYENAVRHHMAPAGRCWTLPGLSKRSTPPRSRQCWAVSSPRCTPFRSTW